MTEKTIAIKYSDGRKTNPDPAKTTMKIAESDVEGCNNNNPYLNVDFCQKRAKELIDSRHILLFGDMRLFHKYTQAQQRGKTTYYKQTMQNFLAHRILYDFCGYYGLSEELVLQYLISPTSSFDSFSFYGKAVHDIHRVICHKSDSPYIEDINFKFELSDPMQIIYDNYLENVDATGLFMRSTRVPVIRNRKKVKFIVNGKIETETSYIPIEETSKQSVMSRKKDSHMIAEVESDKILDFDYWWKRAEDNYNITHSLENDDDYLWERAADNYDTTKSLKNEEGNLKKKYDKILAHIDKLDLKPQELAQRIDDLKAALRKKLYCDVKYVNSPIANVDAPRFMMIDLTSPTTVNLSSDEMNIRYPIERLVGTVTFSDKTVKEHVMQINKLTSVKRIRNSNMRSLANSFNSFLSTQFLNSAIRKLKYYSKYHDKYFTLVPHQIPKKLES